MKTLKIALALAAALTLSACVSGPVVYQDQKPAYAYGGGSGGFGGGESSASQGGQSEKDSKESSGRTNSGETKGPEGTNTSDGTGAGFGSFSG